MHFTFNWTDFNQSAWLSARDSGALTFMPTSEVQRYADSYDEQLLVNQRAITIFANETRLLAPLVMEKDPSDMSKEDIHTLLRGTADTAIGMSILKQLLQQLDQTYQETLKG